ncbi:MAG: BON domain-containing protein [Holosporales bacterium]|nr:BON domain-containing protein [Holosporales bacterium]
MIIGGGVITGGYVGLRDKKIGDSLSDSSLDARIKQRLYKVSPKLFSEVSVVTDRGHVLLTGIVSNPDWIGIAERESWAVKGVMFVANNLTTNGEDSISQTMSDGFVTSACRSALIFKKDVRSVNYKIKTVDSVVYVRGIARTKEELAIVLSTLQKVRRVKKVVSYVEVE